MTRKDGWRRMVTYGCLLLAGLLAAFVATGKAAGAGETEPGQWSDEAVPEGYDESARVRLLFFNASWPKVLQDLAEGTGSKLVMQDVPPGRLNRNDLRRYSRSDAVKLLNLELEPIGFRIQEDGALLIVSNHRATRPRYPRHVVGSSEAPGKAEERTPVRKPEQAVHTIASSRRRPGRDAEMGAEAAGGGSSPGLARIQQAGLEEDTAPDLRQAPVAAERTRQVVIRTENRRASDLARDVYRALKPRAELLDRGPEGLPAFQVFRPDAGGKGRPAGGPRAPQFAVGIDADRDELVIAAAPGVVEEVAEMLHSLDERPPARGRSVRLASSSKDVTRIAQALRPELRRLVAQRAAEDPFPQQDPDDFPDRGRRVEERELAPGEVERRLPLPEADLPGLIRELRGEVVIESVPELGIMIIRGREEDVEAVMRIIQEIERQALALVPAMRLLMLEHVDSAALAELMTTVYERLTAMRVQMPERVTFIPIIKPNAILILAPEVDMESVLRLADELDQPVDPEQQFQVFPLKSAVATQVVEQLEGLYPADDQPGLRARVRAIADVRTNSVIVQARPRDLAEVALLMRRIDRDDSDAVSRVEIFPLRSALAVELAEVINTAIQSVMAAPDVVPPGPAQLGDAKSVVLEFLATDGVAQRLVRSGILADIRVTANPATNDLIVSAPEQSMGLLRELIRQLDRPSPAVAEIKVFTLANGDARAMVELLQALFAVDPAIAQPLGIQIAEAEDAATALIPLRFSVDIRTNSVIAVGGAEALDVVEAILLRLDATDIRQRRTEVVKLKNTPVDTVAEAINQFLQAQRELLLIDPNLITTAEVLEREIIAVPEFVTNSLLLSATPRYFEEIRDLVDRLDAAPPQVVIQALLVEVELDGTDEFGIELGFQDSVLFDRSVIDNIQSIVETITLPTGVQATTQQVVSQEAIPGFAFNNQPLGQNPTLNTRNVGTQGLSNFALGRSNPDLGFGGLVLSASSRNVSVLIRALAARRRVHVLSRPQIRTLDNLPSQIFVGQQVPVITSTLVTQFGTVAPVLGAPQQVGIILAVTPRISPEGNIVMETIATRSSIAPVGIPLQADPVTGTVIESPIFTIAEARTTVSVPNGQTIVLGGMITKSDDTLERKVPWLGDLPLVGALFRHDATRSRRTELLIFLTPRVIHTDADSELIKEIEADRMHFVINDAEDIHGPIFAVPPGPKGIPAPLTGGHPGDGPWNPELPSAPGSEPLWMLPADEDDVPTTIMPPPPGPPAGTYGPPPGTYGPPQRRPPG